MPRNTRKLVPENNYLLRVNKIPPSKFSHVEKQRKKYPQGKKLVASAKVEEKRSTKPFCSCSSSSPSQKRNKERDERKSISDIFQIYFSWEIYQQVSVYVTQPLKEALTETHKQNPSLLPLIIEMSEKLHTLVDTKHITRYPTFQEENERLPSWLLGTSCFHQVSPLPVFLSPRPPINRTDLFYSVTQPPFLTVLQ